MAAIKSQTWEHFYIVLEFIILATNKDKEE